MYRLFAALSPDYEYYRTELKVNICDHTFSCTGSTPIRKGYKEVEEDLKNRLSIKAPEPNDKASDEDFVEQIIPTCAVGDILDLHSVSSEDKYTKPPQRYTDSSLLSAMENAGRTIADKRLWNRHSGDESRNYHISYSGRICRTYQEAPGSD